MHITKQNNIQRSTHTREEPAGPSAVDGREGGRSLIRQENATRAKTSKTLPHPPFMAAQVKTTEKPEPGTDGKLEPTTGWHSNATKPWKGKYDPLRGICSRNWQCFNCTTRILAGIPTTTLLIPGQERCTEMKQVQGRAWVMGAGGMWACLPTADWKRMQPSKGSLQENLTAGFKYARWNERYTHGKKRTTEIRTKKLTGKEMPI